MPAGDTQIVHGTAVALDPERGMLIVGSAGAGKSSLALRMMALGVRLVSDDRVVLDRDGPFVRMSAPSAIRGRIEARGIGILAAEPLDAACLRCVVDLDEVEDARLPPERERVVQGCVIPLLYAVESPYFADGLLQYLRAGRVA